MFDRINISKRLRILVYDDSASRKLQAHLPISENLRSLPATISVSYARAGGEKQNVFEDLRKYPSFKSERWVMGVERSKRHDGQLCGLWGSGLEAERLVEKGQNPDMQQAVQWQAAERRTGEACSQSTAILDGRTGISIEGKDDRCFESSLERRNNLSEEKGLLRIYDTEIRQVSGGVSWDGPERWLRFGVPVGDRSGDRSMFNKGGVRSSR